MIKAVVMLREMVLTHNKKGSIHVCLFQAVLVEAAILVCCQNPKKYVWALKFGSRSCAEHREDLK